MRLPMNKRRKKPPKNEQKRPKEKQKEMEQRKKRKKSSREEFISKKYIQSTIRYKTDIQTNILCFVWMSLFGSWYI